MAARHFTSELTTNFGSILMGVFLSHISWAQPTLNMVNAPLRFDPRAIALNETFGNDPFVGRQTCPVLVRSNPKSLAFEALLLKALPTVNRDNREWEVKLRSGLRWWSGDAVTVKDFQSFISHEINEVSRKIALDRTAKFEIISKGDATLIKFERDPGFGPYEVFVQPLSRSSKAYETGFECVGLYAIHPPKSSDSPLRLELNQGYTAKYKSILFDASGPISGDQLKFGQQNAKQDERHILKSICSQKLDTSTFSAIIWNQNRPLVSQPGLRRAMTKAMPRGEIIRTVYLDFGTLSSGGLIRPHPAYVEQLSAHPFSLEQSDADLTSFGYVQPSPKDSRKDQKTGDVVALSLATLKSQDFSTLKKVLGDSLSSLGIKVTFESIGALTPEELKGTDGVLIHGAFDWQKGLPEFLIEKSNPVKGLWDERIDKLVSEYLQRYHAGSFDMAKLRAIHQAFFDLEPWTMILGHQVCVTSEGRITIPRSATLVMDPDWVRKLVL